MPHMRRLRGLGSHVHVNKAIGFLNTPKLAFPLLREGRCCDLCGQSLTKGFCLQPPTLKCWVWPGQGRINSTAWHMAIRFSPVCLCFQCWTEPQYSRWAGGGLTALLKCLFSWLYHELVFLRAFQWFWFLVWGRAQPNSHFPVVLGLLGCCQDVRE